MSRSKTGVAEAFAYADFRRPGEMGTGAKLAMVLGFYVLSMGGVIYFALFESSGWQATFGKRLLNIYVTDRDGTRIGVLRALGRWSSKFFLGYLGGLNIASLVTIPCTKDKKALHDYVAKTLVVRGRPVSGGSIEAWRVVVAFGIPFVWLMGTCLATF